MMVFGVGTGRSGSYSLCELLNSQKDSNITHESYWCPWNYDSVHKDLFVSGIKGRKEGLVGDVGSYLINYVEFIDGKFICLKRDRKETVDSWFRHSGEFNHWTLRSSKFFEGKTNELTGIFPKYDLPKYEALEMYWDEYYLLAESLQIRFPDKFRIWDIEALNSKDGQDSILRFIGIPLRDRVYGDFYLNRTGDELIVVKPFGYKSGPCDKCDNPAEYSISNKTRGSAEYLCEECKEELCEVNV